MKFTKMHGLGNDYVFVDLAQETIAQPAELARAISSRHGGVGSDGLILIAPSDKADVRMEMYNADGSRGQMCGNGIRCVAKFAVDHALAVGPDLRIETDAGIKSVRCLWGNKHQATVRVDMGVPSLQTSSLPAVWAESRMINVGLSADGVLFEITCVSMGNPHAVLYHESLKRDDTVRIGPVLERHHAFPEGINVHFVRVDSPGHVTMQTWERGSGATQACGTGACAVCVAGVITNRTERRITATLPGGDLEISWADDDHVYMTGPVVEVFTGTWPTD